MVNLLDADPDLAAGLSPGEVAALRQHAIAPVIELEPGPWIPDERRFDPERTLGAIVLDGLVARELEVGGSSALELLGGGDLIRPCHEDHHNVLVRSDSSWIVLEPARLAILDQRIGTLCTRFPRLVSTLLGRGVQRARTLATHVALSHLTRVDMRLLVLLWHLADRFGRVAPGGVTIPVRLTHEMLAKLVGARRPSVSTAMSDLARRGLLTARRGEFIVLHGDPPATVAADEERVEAERVLGAATIAG